MRLKKKILCAALCMCMVCTLAGVAGIQANADSVPADFSFNVKLAGDSAYKYYDGGDTDTFSISNWKNGSGSYSGGTITATNAGGSSTIQLRESKNFKNAEYILVPFTMSVKVPAYTAYTVDTKIQLSLNRNAKGASWYVFEWADNTGNAAYDNSFSTKMDLTTTDGFVYRAYGNDKTYNPTEEGTLVFDNRTGDTATTITRQYAIFAGNSRSASLLKSYHHQLETSLTLTPTSVTATKVITYYNEGELVGSQQYSSDSKALFSTVPSKKGYVFTGWLGSDGKTYQPGATYNGSTGLKLTAQWREGKSTVTFDPNDGTVDPVTREVCVDNIYDDLPTPTRDYYTFLGWYTSANGGSKVTKDTVVTKTEDHTLYAHWMNKTAYVKFDPNGGSPSSSVTMNAGKKLSDIPGFATNPTRTNYTFAGWYTAKDEGTQVTGDTIISDSVTYYAHWTGRESAVTLKYNDGSTNDGTINVNYGGTYSNLPTPTRTNYTFNGWYTAESGGSRVTDSTTVTAKADHILYARWTRNVANIQFMDGDNTIASRTVNAGDTLGDLPQPAKTGYTFDGWYTAATDGTEVTANTEITQTANYYAHWTAKTYTVTFDKNDGTAGGSSSETESLNYGSNYTLPEAPERTGYTFLGWFTAASGGTKVTTGTAVSRAENHTLYAQWERVVYTVTFKNGTSTVETRRINAGDSLGTLPAAAKTGYTFKGWYTSENGGTKVNNTDTISAGATYYAQWTANQYTITFNLNGGTVTDGTKTLEYGNKLTLPAAPIRTGYTFEGWYTAATGSSEVTANTTFTTAADTTYYAHWTAKQYRVDFDYNGSNQGTLWRTISYGDTYGYTNSGKVVMISTEPKRDGYNFVGWYTAASGGTQVSANTVMNRTEAHTLYAHWETQHKHAVAPDGTAVEFDKALTADVIESWTTGKGASNSWKIMPAGNYYLTSDIETERCIDVASNATVNICFNGHTITSTYSGNSPNSALNNTDNGTLKICDCQGGGGLSGAASFCLCVSDATSQTELYGGTFVSGSFGAQVNRGSSLLVDGATIKATGIAISPNSSSSTVTINSGTVTSSGSYAIRAETGTVTINGGTVSRTDTSDGGTALYAGSSSIVTISGGTVTSSSGGTVSCETPNFTVTGGTITNTGKWLRVISATNDKAHITLSGSPSIGRITIDSDAEKITVGENLSGTYQISLNRPEDVTEAAPVTLTTGSDKDNTARFVLVESNATGCALRDVMVDGKHTVQIYRPHKHNGVEWDYTVLTSSTITLENGKQYILAEDMTSNLTVPSGATADLCLNGKTLTGKITVNGTLNLYDCKNGDGITNSSGSVIVVNGIGALNYYGGKLTGGNGDYVPLYVNTGGTVNLYSTPTISTSCDYEIRGNSQGFLHICKTLTMPNSPLRINFGTDSSVKITDHKQVTVTSGWSAYMRSANPTEYFAPRANRTAKIDTNEDGELVLRLLRVTIDGKTYYPAYDGGKITDLPDKPTKTGYIWQGYYTAETGGTKQEISSSTVFTDDMTLYSQWKECDHGANTSAIEKTAATCTAVGSEKYTCSVCGLAIETVIPALGHSYSEAWVKDDERGTHYHSCTTCTARIDEAEHTWKTDTTTAATCENAGSVTYKCEACAAIKIETIPALGHDYSNEWLNNDTNHWHKCSRSDCNGTANDEVHEWDDGVVTTEATTDSEGTKTFTCGICGKTKTETIEKVSAPEPTKYTVTYQLDEDTVGSVPTQEATAKDGTITLGDGSTLTRTGYKFAGWALLDENGVAGNNTLTGEFTMPERDVTFVVRWTRLGSYDLKSGDTIVLEDNTIVRNIDGKKVTIDQGGTGTVDTTITLPDGSETVTVTNSGNKDKIIVPAGSTVRTGNTTVTISGGSGSVEITGAVNAPAGSSVTDGNDNTITINSGSGRIDTDGTVNFSGNKGNVSVKDKSGNTTTVDVPAGGEGITVTQNGTPLVDNGDNGVTIVSADGTTTTITLPESADADAGIDETNNGVSVPAGSTITTTKGNTTTTTTISEGTGNVASDGKVTLPSGGKVVTKDSNGEEITSTVEKGESVDLAHTHSWSDDWSKNSTYHWHNCSIENCPIKVESEKNSYAEHDYNQSKVTEEYLKSAATCTAKAEYYKSCICGAKGTETFEYGEVDANNHDLEHHNAQAATCTEIGWNAYDTCKREGCTYTTKTEISAKDHAYGDLIERVDATCNATGMAAHYKCSVCDKYFDEDKIEKTLEALTIGKDSDNHANTATTWTKTATTHKETYNCCGAVKTAEANHTWNNGQCTECGYYCQHTGVTDDGDCTTAVVCSVCNMTTIAANTTHTWGEWNSDNGQHTHSCTVDGCNGTENGACSGGTATCIAKAKCETCGAEYGAFADHDYNKSEWGYKGADGHAHACKTVGCTAHDTVTNHTSSGEATEDTDEKCTECGYVIKAALGHTHRWEPVSEIPATCKTAGIKEHYKCSCNQLAVLSNENYIVTAENDLILAIDADKHEQTADWTTKTATQHEKTYPCCGAVVVELENHDWDGGTITTAPTTSSEGVRTYTCTVCSVTKTEPIAKLPSGGGSSGGGTVVTPPKTEAITADVTGDKTSVKITAEISEESATVAEINKTDLDKAGTGADITIDLSVLPKEITSATVTKKSLENVCDSEAEKVSIKLTEATVNMDRGTLENIIDQMKGKDLKLVVDKHEEAIESMNEVQKNTVSEMSSPKLMDAYFISGGTRITDFRGGSVDIEVPYPDKKGVKAWYIDDNGNKEQVPVKYDGKTAVITVSHFSYYVLEEYTPDTVEPVTADTLNKVIYVKSIKYTKKTGTKITFNKVPGADGYYIYGNKCNTNKVYKFKKLATLKGNDNTVFVHKKTAKNTFYKYYIRAYKIVDGRKVTVSTSKEIHMVTDVKGYSYGNPTKIKLSVSKRTISKGKTFNLKNRVKVYSSKKVLLHTAKVRYVSSDSSIAKVNSSGKITAKKTGKCYVYAIAQNGIATRIAVTVK